MKRIAIMLSVMAALVSCNKEIETIGGTASELTGVVASAVDFVIPATKTTISQSGSAAPTFAWKEGDVIGIIPMDNKTVQSNYEIDQIGANPKEASFDGGVWALKEGKEYAAYYPFQKEAAISSESLMLYFDGQTQTGNNSLAHLGDYDFMYAKAISPADGIANFEFKHLVSLLRLQLTVPAGTYSNIRLDSDDRWFGSGSSLALATGEVTPVGISSVAHIALTDVTLTSAGILTVWMSIPPTAELEGKSLDITAYSTNGKFIGSISNLKVFEAGMAYTYSATLEPDYVDLGLSVKWARCNVGANKPEEFGDYFAWGDTEPYYESLNPLVWKSGKTGGYTEENYKYYSSCKEVVDGNEEVKNGYTKYVLQSNAGVDGFEGFYDDKTTLDLEDDAAHVALGGQYRMPTKDEWRELYEDCTWVWTTLKGVEGYKVQSKITGHTDNWIFIPAAGHMTQDNLYVDNSTGYYWSSSIFQTNASTHATYTRIASNRVNITNGNMRCWGWTIRPVCE